MIVKNFKAVEGRISRPDRRVQKCELLSFFGDRVEFPDQRKSASCCLFYCRLKAVRSSFRFLVTNQRKWNLNEECCHLRPRSRWPHFQRSKAALSPFFSDQPMQVEFEWRERERVVVSGPDPVQVGLWTFEVFLDFFGGCSTEYCYIPMNSSTLQCWLDPAMEPHF